MARLMVRYAAATIGVWIGSRGGTSSCGGSEAPSSAYDRSNLPRARVTARSFANGSGPPPRAVCRVWCADRPGLAPAEWPRTGFAYTADPPT